ncbi:MAG: glycosyltransferase family 2 protein [Candidatus Omnitrophica bacterium]|nr:glycosyltransferase family 2 protein [Candidatus Omnitrophota bacterium]
MKCDIIIPVWNQLEATRECVESIVKNTTIPYRLILVDNASDKNTAAYLDGIKASGVAPAVIISNNENLGFVKAVNQGLRLSDAPYVCVMNNDTIPAKGWLENMIDFMERHPDVGLANPQCDGHGDLPIEEHAANLSLLKDAYMEMNQCFGYCMLIRREVLEKIGYLDEAFGMGNYDDTDYSMRAGKAGYRCVNVHSAYVYHKKHVSFNAAGNREALVSEGAREYFKKWPRHLRAGVSFRIDKDTCDAEIISLLEGILYLAREWCWVNVWIFGDKAIAKARVSEAASKINMPLHQNLKMSYCPGRFRGLQVLARLIERSFGTKRRKKYDMVFVVYDKTASFLKFFGHLHKTNVIPITPEIGFIKEAERAIADTRISESSLRGPERPEAIYTEEIASSENGQAVSS